MRKARSSNKHDDAGAGLHILDPMLRRGYTSVPNGILRCSTLRQGPKLLYLYILSYASQGKAWPGQTRIARELNTTDRTVRRWLRELKELNLVSARRRGFSQQNDYYLLPLPDWLKAELEEAVPSQDNMSGMDEEAVPIQDNMSGMDEEALIQDNMSGMEKDVTIQDNMSGMEAKMAENAPNTPIQDNMSGHSGQYVRVKKEEEEDIYLLHNTTSSSKRSAVGKDGSKQPTAAQIVALDLFLKSKGVYRAEQIAGELLRRYGSLAEAKAFVLAHEIDIAGSGYPGDKSRRLLAWRIRNPDEAPVPDALLDQARRLIATGRDKPPSSELETYEDRLQRYVGEWGNIIEH